MEKYSKKSFEHSQAKTFYLMILKSQMELRKSRSRAVIGGFRDNCRLSGELLQNQSRVIFTEEDAEYLTKAIKGSYNLI